VKLIVEQTLLNLMFSIFLTLSYYNIRHLILVVPLLYLYLIYCIYILLYLQVRRFSTAGTRPVPGLELFWKLQNSLNSVLIRYQLLNLVNKMIENAIQGKLTLSWSIL